MRPYGNGASSSVSLSLTKFGIDKGVPVIRGSSMKVRHEGAKECLCEDMSILQQPCCAGDEGRSLEVSLQERASNHLKLHRLRAVVVSVEEKAGHDLVRWGTRRRAKANH